MKKILLSLSGLLVAFISFSQDKEAKSFVSPAFETSILFDNSTTSSPFKGSYEFEIHHRFGKINNGITDLFGVYAPSNIRMGLNYGVTDRLMVGFGTIKDKKLQEFQGKYAILRQTDGGEMPVSVSLYGNAVIDAGPKENFYGDDENDYKFSHRMSYFSQLIIARSFGYKYSVQVAPTYMFFKAVEKGRENANFGIHVGGKANVYGSASIIAEYNTILTKQPDSNFDPKPSLAYGIELNSGTHIFQIFATNYKAITGQHNFLFNTNDFTISEYMIGFNITVRF